MRRGRRVFASSMRCIIGTIQATTRPGRTSRRSRRQLGRIRSSKLERGAARSATNSRRSRATSCPWSIGAPAALPTPIWIYCSKRTASISSSSSVSSRDYADNEMHAALDVNLPNYASVIVSTEEIVALISALENLGVRIEHSRASAGLSDESKQALDRRGARHRNRSPDRRLCWIYDHAADIHGSLGDLSSRLPRRSSTQSSRLDFARARERMAQFAAAEGVGSARESRARRFLDLHLHQLAAHASVCPCLGREVSES